jgi:hypothetical protein
MERKVSHVVFLPAGSIPRGMEERGIHMTEQNIRSIGEHLALVLREQFQQDIGIFHPGNEHGTDEVCEGWVEDTTGQVVLLRLHGERIGMTVYPMDRDFCRHAHYWVTSPKDAAEKMSKFLELNS